MCHLVVCSSQLEREDWLQVLALEEDLAVQPVGKVDGMSQWSLVDNLVYSGSEDKT